MCGTFVAAAHHHQLKAFSIEMWQWPSSTVGSKTRSPCCMRSDNRLCFTSGDRPPRPTIKQTRVPLVLYAAHVLQSHRGIDVSGEVYANENTHTQTHLILAASERVQQAMADDEQSLPACIANRDIYFDIALCVVVSEALYTQQPRVHGIEVQPSACQRDTLTSCAFGGMSRRRGRRRHSRGRTCGGVSTFVMAAALAVGWTVLLNTALQQFQHAHA